MMQSNRVSGFKLQRVSALFFGCILILAFFAPLSHAVKLSPYSNKELEQLEREFIQLINQSEQVEREPIAAQYINSLGNKLARHGKINNPYFFIVKSKEINAFAGPGGYIGINTQLILTTESESIAVNGVCLTVLADTEGRLLFDLSSETLGLTTLGGLVAGEEVNLERAMSAATRFGGHYVTGHVDTKAIIKSLQQQGEFVKMELSGFNEDAFLYLVVKGSLALDGVSLTINDKRDRSVELMLVPHTLMKTTLSSLKTGQYVNIEFDYLTRIVAHQLRLISGISSEVEA